MENRNIVEWKSKIVQNDKRFSSKEGSEGERSFSRYDPLRCWRLKVKEYGSLACKKSTFIANFELKN